MMKKHTTEELREIYDNNDFNYKCLYYMVDQSSLDLEYILDIKKLKTFNELIENITFNFKKNLVDTLPKHIEDTDLFKINTSYEYGNDNEQYFICECIHYKKREFDDFVRVYNFELEKELEEKNKYDEKKKEEEYKEYLRLKKKFEENESTE